MGGECLNCDFRKIDRINMIFQNMKKKISLLVAVTLLSVASAFAQGGTTGPLTWNLNNGTLTISGEGAMPDYGGGESPWYKYRLSVNTVVVETGVTSIGNMAFFNCQNLTSVTISNGVTSIGDYAFSSCEKLTLITIPNSVMSIGEEAFYGCWSISSITIPKSVTSIGNSAFYY
jgi:hypothetical protein